MKRSVFESTPRLVRKEVDALAANERLAIMLVCVEGLSYQEAAARLSISVEEIKLRLMRGRLTLMGRLAAKERCLPRSGIVRHGDDGRGRRIADGRARDGA